MAFGDDYSLSLIFHHMTASEFQLINGRSIYKCKFPSGLQFRILWIFYQVCVVEVVQILDKLKVHATGSIVTLWTGLYPLWDIAFKIIIHLCPSVVRKDSLMM